MQHMKSAGQPGLSSLMTWISGAASGATSVTIPAPVSLMTIWGVSSVQYVGASLLIVCSPVYTNTVPGGLKLVIDRCQAYHAEREISGGRKGQKGLVFSVAGRKGEENFTCVTRVIFAYLRNLGIDPVGEILIDRVDAIRDIRTIAGMEENVKDKVKQHLIVQKAAGK